MTYFRTLNERCLITCEPLHIPLQDLTSSTDSEPSFTIDHKMMKHICPFLVPTIYNVFVYIFIKSESVYTLMFNEIYMLLQIHYTRVIMYSKGPNDMVLYIEVCYNR